MQGTIRKPKPPDLRSAQSVLLEAQTVARLGITVPRPEAKPSKAPQRVRIRERTFADTAHLKEVGAASFLAIEPDTYAPATSGVLRPGYELLPFLGRQVGSSGNGRLKLHMPMTVFTHDMQLWMLSTNHRGELTRRALPSAAEEEANAEDESAVDLGDWRADFTDACRAARPEAAGAAGSRAVVAVCRRPQWRGAVTNVTTVVSAGHLAYTLGDTTDMSPAVMLQPYVRNGSRYAHYQRVLWQRGRKPKGWTFSSAAPRDEAAAAPDSPVASNAGPSVFAHTEVASAAAAAPAAPADTNRTLRQMKELSDAVGASHLVSCRDPHTNELTVDSAATLRLTRLSGHALAKTGPLAADLADYLGRVSAKAVGYAVELEMLAADFIADASGTWWFTGVKAFKFCGRSVDLLREWHLATLADAQGGDDDFGALGAAATTTRKRPPSGKAAALAAAEQRHSKCQFCGAWYELSDVVDDEEGQSVSAYGYTMTFRMAVGLARYLQSLGGEGRFLSETPPELLHAAQQAQARADESGRPEVAAHHGMSTLTTCYLCYRLFAAQQLQRAASAKLAQRLGAPDPRSADAAPRPAYESHDNKHHAQPRRVTGPGAGFERGDSAWSREHIPAGAACWRMLVMAHHLVDVHLPPDHRYADGYGTVAYALGRCRGVARFALAHDRRSGAGAGQRLVRNASQHYFFGTRDAVRQLLAKKHLDLKLRCGPPECYVDLDQPRAAERSMPAEAAGTLPLGGLQWATGRDGTDKLDFLVPMATRSFGTALLKVSVAIVLEDGYPLDRINDIHKERFLREGNVFWPGPEFSLPAPIPEAWLYMMDTFVPHASRRPESPLSPVRSGAPASPSRIGDHGKAAAAELLKIRGRKRDAVLLEVFGVDKAAAAATARPQDAPALSLPDDGPSATFPARLLREVFDALHPSDDGSVPVEALVPLCRERAASQEVRLASALLVQRCYRKWRRRASGAAAPETLRKRASQANAAMAAAILCDLGAGSAARRLRQVAELIDTMHLHGKLGDHAHWGALIAALQGPWCEMHRTAETGRDGAPLSELDQRRNEMVRVLTSHSTLVVEPSHSLWRRQRRMLLFHEIYETSVGRDAEVGEVYGNLQRRLEELSEASRAVATRWAPSASHKRSAAAPPEGGRAIPVQAAAALFAPAVRKHEGARKLLKHLIDRVLTSARMRTEYEQYLERATSSFTQIDFCLLAEDAVHETSRDEPPHTEAERVAAEDMKVVQGKMRELESNIRAREAVAKSPEKAEEEAPSHLRGKAVLRARAWAKALKGGSPSKSPAKAPPLERAEPPWVAAFCRESCPLHGQDTPFYVADLCCVKCEAAAREREADTMHREHQLRHARALAAPEPAAGEAPTTPRSPLLLEGEALSPLETAIGNAKRGKMLDSASTRAIRQYVGRQTSALGAAPEPVSHRSFAAPADLDDGGPDGAEDSEVAAATAAMAGLSSGRTLRSPTSRKTVAQLRVMARSAQAAAVAVGRLKKRRKPKKGAAKSTAGKRKKKRHLHRSASDLPVASRASNADTIAREIGTSTPHRKELVGMLREREAHAEHLRSAIALELAGLREAPLTNERRSSAGVGEFVTGSLQRSRSASGGYSGF